MNAEVEAIAYRVWAYCKDRGWNDTVPDIADALDLPMTKVRAVVRVKGWNNRLPTKVTTQYEHGDFRVSIDGALDMLARQ